jgi:hypothetical protein
MSGSLAQLLVATAQSQSQLVLQLAELGKFPLYVRQLFSQPAPHGRTGLQAASAQIQQTADLAEFESQTLHASDKSQCLDIGFPILAESSLPP